MHESVLLTVKICRGYWERPVKLSFVKDFWISKINFSCRYTLGRGPTGNTYQPPPYLGSSLVAGTPKLGSRMDRGRGSRGRYEDAGRRGVRGTETQNHNHIANFPVGLSEGAQAPQPHKSSSGPPGVLVPSVATLN